MYTVSSERDDLVISSLRDHFGNAIGTAETLADMLCITVDKDRINDIMLFLKNDNSLNFNFLTTLCGMHYPEKDQLGVVYHLHSFIHNHRIRIKVTTPLADPTVPSVTSIWPASNWMEREAFDFYGIQFTGHPNLKRILNVDEMTSFPMRKDFPLEDQTREDKDDNMFGR